MKYVLIFSVGVFIGILTTVIISIVCFSGYVDRTQEAYNARYEAGLKKRNQV